MEDEARITDCGRHFRMNFIGLEVKRAYYFKYSEDNKNKESPRLHFQYINYRIIFPEKSEKSIDETTVEEETHLILLPYRILLEQLVGLYLFFNTT